MICSAVLLHNTSHKAEKKRKRLNTEEGVTADPGPLHRSRWKEDPEHNMMEEVTPPVGEASPCPPGRTEEELGMKLASLDLCFLKQGLASRTQRSPWLLTGGATQ